LIDELGLKSKLWYATKVWTRGREAGAKQIDESFARLRTQPQRLQGGLEVAGVGINGHFVAEGPMVTPPAAAVDATM